MIVIYRYFSVHNGSTKTVYSSSNRAFPWSKCHFTLSITEFLPAIYILLGHLFKYVTQIMTAYWMADEIITTQFSMKSLKINQHHDHFCTKCYSNWKSLSGINFNEYISNSGTVAKAIHLQLCNWFGCGLQNPLK